MPTSASIAALSFEHLARSVWFGKARRDSLIMAITAYFDDSGTDPKNPSIVVAGFVSTVDQWDRFNDEWLAAELEFEAPPFHAKIFDDGRRGYGPYKDWLDSKRKDYVNRLLGIISRRTRHSFSTALRKDAYDTLIAPQQAFREYFYSQFAFSSVNCVFQVCDWRNQYH